MNDYSSTDREDLATEPQTLDEQTPGQVELVTETKTLHIDGEPFPWPVIGVRLATGPDRMSTLTVDIPVKRISVRALEPDGGHRQERSSR